MPNYRRCYVPGGAYFFTVVTHRRRPIFASAAARALLHRAVEEDLSARPFTLFAAALLPDHLHAVWMLPDGDADYSTRWGRIKERFTRAFLGAGGPEETVTTNRRRHRERGVWQPRFWEHAIRDEDDLGRCVDYIHWNPVKHGHAARVRDYPWTSFERFVRSGDYEPGWGGEPAADVSGAEWE